MCHGSRGLRPDLELLRRFLNECLQPLSGSNLGKWTYRTIGQLQCSASLRACQVRHAQRLRREGERFRCIASYRVFVAMEDGRPVLLRMVAIDDPGTPDRKRTLDGKTFTQAEP